jgi:midasin
LQGSSEIEELTGHPSFRIMATMNPGGDFGKKELSPAMRNRFTEIWVPNRMEDEEMVLINFIQHNSSRCKSLKNGL